MAVESKNFKEHELVCSHCGKSGVQQWALDKLQEVRDVWGKPMNLSSAYRCPEHPEEIKKVKGGTHTQGIAFDVKTTPAEQVELIAIAHKLGFGGFGLGKTFTHLDMRPRKKNGAVSAWHYK